jgi:DNA-binding protein Fis
MTEPKKNTLSALEQLIAELGETDNLLDLLYDSVDRAAVVYAHKKFQNNKTKIAEFLGISRTTLLKKMKNLHM